LRERPDAGVHVPRAVGQCLVGGIAPIFREQDASDEGGIRGRERRVLHGEERDEKQH
jgi:hypothetical protein